MQTLTGPTIGYNVLRALCSGITLSIVFAIAATFGGASSTLSGGELVTTIFGLAFTPLIILPVGLLCAWIAKTFRGWFMSGNPVAGVIGIFVGGYFWITLLAMMIGDPGVLLLKSIAPGIVPVAKPGLWNPHLLVLVQGAGEDGAAEEELPSFERQRSPDYRSDDRSPAAKPAAAAAAQRVAAQAPPEWIESTSNIENDDIRLALERANADLDEATVLIHPPLEIDAAKADEIDTILVRVRDSLAAARSVNDHVNEPGLADYLELLDASAEQYAGIAQALGRKRLAEGARLIERAVDRLERLARKQGQKTTHHLSLYLLTLIHLDLGDKSAALSFIVRACNADPDDAVYRKLRYEIEDELEGSRATPPRRSGGGALGVLVIAVLVVLVGGAGVYLWRSNQQTLQVQAPVVDANRFDVLPYTAQQVIVAREGELNIRALPFSRPDIAVVRQTFAGETLNVVGLVNQLDGPWYQVQLADGRVGYFKASLAVPQSEYLTSSVGRFVGEWANTDTATRNLTHVSVRQAEGATYVRVYGSCAPTDCDWGETLLSIASYEIEGRPAAIATVATYDHGFSEATVLLILDDGDMEYRVSTHFKDGSGRQDYVSTGSLRRASDRGVAPSASQTVERGAASANPAIDIEGAWRGEYWREGRRPTTVEMRVSTDGDQISGTGSEPRLLGPLYLSVSGAVQADRSVLLVMSAPGGPDMQYNGTLSDDGATIAGEWRRGANSGSFRLQRE